MITINWFLEVVLDDVFMMSILINSRGLLGKRVGALLTGVESILSDTKGAICDIVVQIVASEGPIEVSTDVIVHMSSTLVALRTG